MKEYIDLGLPSGTKWSSENEEGYYTYDEAVELFKDNLPSKEQFEELINECLWEWDYEKEGYIVTGSNGNSIFLHAAGFRNSDGSLHLVDSWSCYWSSTANGSDEAWCLDCRKSKVGCFSDYRCYSLFVQFVK